MERELGKADWIWDDEFQIHMPSCTVLTSYRGMTVRCGNGPLTGENILTGDCGEHDHGAAYRDVMTTPVTLTPEDEDAVLALMRDVAARTRDNPPDLAGALDEMRGVDSQVLATTAAGVIMYLREALDYIDAHAPNGEEASRIADEALAGTWRSPECCNGHGLERRVNRELHHEGT